MNTSPLLRALEEPNPCSMFQDYSSRKVRVAGLVVYFSRPASTALAEGGKRPVEIDWCLRLRAAVILGGRRTLQSHLPILRFLLRADVVIEIGQSQSGFSKGIHRWPRMASSAARRNPSCRRFSSRP
ncbi:hypothetical protein GWK47_042738 [Chionoecetes opilio]|uniref:Uncharacterized protein n=1 Tax=Chionoecetes opilio TaxID=41210 RepID=A0A8J4Y8L2_CHIOP|nr:hypothetical protein GWK47_042738 [Chionoecetes opilio]